MKIAKRLKFWFLITVALLLVSGCGGNIKTSLSSDPNQKFGTGITNTANHPSEMNIGDIMAFDINGEDAFIDFEGVDEDAKFLLITGTSNIYNGSSFEIAAILESDLDESIGVDPIEDGADINDYYGEDEAFSARLRAAEAELTYGKNIVAYNDELSPDLNMSISEGSVRRFKVFADLALRNYAHVDAEAKCVGVNIALFVDLRVDDDALSSEDIQELCEEYDETAGRTIDLLGHTSDVNGDELITVLITPQINSLETSSNSYVAGYFYAGDLYEPSGSNEVSNAQEIIYAIAPDPSGEYGSPKAKGYIVDHVLRSVFPHELQHLINYNRHVFDHGGPTEESWLNEGLSHLIEDLTGHGGGNPMRYQYYLSKPSATSLVTPNSPDLAERGAIYLFLRFLYEQADDGNAFIRALVDTNKIGVENVVAAFAGSDSNFDQLSEFMVRWTVALAMTAGEISDDPRYTYKSRTINYDTRNWEGVIMRGVADNGRGTILSGIKLNRFSGYDSHSLASSSAKYYRLNSVPIDISIIADGLDKYAVLIREE